MLDSLDLLIVLRGVHELHNTSLLAFKAATGHCIKPKWTKQAAAILRGTSQDITLERDMLFSTDGSMLLCVQDYDVPPEEFSLHILDIQGGSIVAASPLSQVRRRGLARYEYGDTLDVTMLWHPASDGFVVPGCTFQLDDQPFKKAGLATGHCPLPAFLGENSAFSPTGELLLAAGPDKSFQGQHPLHKVPLAILQVAQHEHEYTFTMLHLLEDAGCSSLRGAWMPAGLHGRECLLLDDNRGLKLVTPQGQLLGSIDLPGCKLPGYKALHEQPCVSVCGQFCQIFKFWDRRATACILHCLSEKIYEPISSASRSTAFVVASMWLLPGAER